LADNDYIYQPPSSRTYRVKPDRWTELDEAFSEGKQPHVEFAGSKKPAFTIDPSVVARRLRDVDVLRFVGLGNRSPYVGHFVFQGAPFTVVLFHAPNPGDRTKYAAINNIALSPILHGVDFDLLVMGDFNIKEGQSRAVATYSRDPWEAVPNKKTAFRPVFDPIAKDLGAKPQTFKPSGLTSLRKPYLTSLASSVAGLYQPYDRFFLRQKRLVGKTPTVHDHLEQIASSTPTTSTSNPSKKASLKGLARDAFRLFRALKLESKETELNAAKAVEAEAEAEIQKLKADPSGPDNKRLKAAEGMKRKATKAVKDAEAGVAKYNKWLKWLVGPQPDTLTLAESHLVYHDGVSDHLPISIELHKP
ncbi:MAG TPA: hypothetical protein VIG64_04195, partial [Actinomycetota bacterium]